MFSHPNLSCSLDTFISHLKCEMQRNRKWTSRKDDGVHHRPCRHMVVLQSESDPPLSLRHIYHREYNHHCSMFLDRALFSESAATGVARLIIEMKSIKELGLREKELGANEREHGIRRTLSSTQSNIGTGLPGTRTLGFESCFQIEAQNRPLR